MNDFSFKVLGRPVPQGSMKGFVHGEKVCLTSDNAKMKPWRQMVAWEALRQKLTDSLYAPAGVPVSIRIDFFFEKPSSYSKKITRPIKKPDIDKLCRAILDALTGIAWKDDAQVVEMISFKHFGLPERAEITIERIESCQ